MADTRAGGGVPGGAGGEDFVDSLKNESEVVMAESREQKSFPYAEAIGAYKETEEFQRIADLFSLKSTSDDKYLINRLELAFAAGWNHARAYHKIVESD